MSEHPAAGGLPAFTLRADPRARRIRLRVSARDGLVVVTPPGVPARVARDAVAERREWVAETLARVAGDRALRTAGAEAVLPSEVAFAATGEAWRVEYVHRPDTGTRVVERPGELEVRGDVADADACLAALRRWLQRAARARLLPWLAEVSRDEGLPYVRVSVRGQRSRWGSCSTAGTVSLNRALLFLEPGLVRAVLLHELVHTLAADHSARFWAELERRDPHAREDRRRMREGWGEVPPWAEP